ncbi:WD40 repeat-like protein [Xylariomycetidae sp. FL2044]|nr:WD40 repeat-like protein [Xylariomycetidae sp. FL2044]
MAEQPPAHPKSILRGHRVQVHATAFVRSNQRLASGDADGFVVVWDLTTMRPRAVWRAHSNAILEIADWGPDRIITHGRDNRLVVWKLGAADEAPLSTALPLDDSVSERPQPWILHMLEVNTMNFCSFASCLAKPENASDDLLVVVPNTLATEAVDVYQLPSQSRQDTLHLGSKAEQKGMAMALSLFWHNRSLTLIAAFESGLVIVARRRKSGSWDIVYKSKAHDQPVLSLGLSPTREYFLTSAADAVIAKHPIPASASSSTSVATGVPSPVRNAGMPVESGPLKTINTKHSGQQGLQIRSDGKIFATAGWDSKVRVYSAKTMSELAVLKWHQVGCYTVAFAVLGQMPDTPSGQKAGGENQGEGGTTDAEKNQASTIVNPGTKSRGASVKDRRIKLAKEAHWLAAGSKDGKISLWDIY